VRAGPIAVVATRGRCYTASAFQSNVAQQCDSPVGLPRVEENDAGGVTAEPRSASPAFRFCRDPAVLIHSTIASYPNLQDHSADIQVEGILPSVLANQIGLIQCFANLFGNAVKFVRPGVLPRIRVWAERRSNFIRIWIEDNGIGIPAALRPKLFAMFQRGSREYEGTGIGLALVKKVLERMGGRAGVESEPGRGSRFWIELESARIRDSETTDRGDNG